MDNMTSNDKELVAELRKAASYDDNADSSKLLQAANRLEQLVKESELKEIWEEGWQQIIYKDKIVRCVGNVQPQVSDDNGKTWRDLEGQFPTGEVLYSNCIIHQDKAV